MPRPILRTPILSATAIVGALTLIPLATSAMAAVDTDTYREFDQFLDVFNRVKAEYVDKVDDKTLIKGAIQGMLASLDPHNARVVMDALRRIHAEDGLTVLVNLHHLDTAREYCGRIVGLRAGRVMFDGAPAELTPDRVHAVYGANADERVGAEVGAVQA